MKFVSLTYTKKTHFKDPLVWLRRVRAYIGVLEALSKSHSVTSVDRIDYQGDLLMNGVSHHFPGFGGNWLTSAWKLNRHTKSLKPDIVLVQGMIFPLQIILLRIQLGRGVKIIAQNHAELPGRRHRKIFQQLADPFIDAYLFTSKEMGTEWVQKHIIRRPEKIREVMEASSVFQQVDSREARTFLNITGSPLFLWVGRLDQNKDPLTVLTAFLQFATLRPSARLHMLFHTKELLPAVEELLRNTAVGRESVILQGEKPNDEMGWWYSAADYIISGSHYEGSGIAVCEAMSCGCIPVLTDILSFRMMTVNGSCGILYQAGSPESLLPALQQITERDLVTEQEKALRQFQTTLSFEAIACQIGEIAASL